MNITLTKILLVITFLFSFQDFPQKKGLESSEKIMTPEDLKVLLGEWNGNLTYTDYSSNKPYTMPSNLDVKQGKNDRQLLLLITYPNEPKANSKEKISISKNGDQLNKNIVKSNQILTNGQVQIITEYSGKDNNKKAQIRNVYILGKQQFVIRKEVQFENSKEWLKRNEYNFKR